MEIFFNLLAHNARRRYRLAPYKSRRDVSKGYEKRLITV